jgi:transcriptional regulator with XRE-family HTH domain
MSSKKRKFPGLGKRLQEARKFAGLTQVELAAKVGCGWENVAKIEGEGSDPSVTLILLLCERLTLSFRWLTRGEGAKYKEGSIEADIMAEAPALYLKRKELIERVRTLANETKDEGQLDALINTIKMIDPQKKKEECG